MWVSGLKLTGIRCFKNEELNFSRGVNIIVGQNNSGKSSILKAIHTLQDGCVPLNDTDKRKATQQGIVEIKLKGEKSLFASFLGSAEFDRLTYDIKNPRMKTFFRGSGSRSSQSLIPQVEPSNFIYPYFSSRKVVAYNEQINAQHTNSVPGNFQNLYPKIDRIANPANEEAYDYFVKACDEILGFRVSCVASSGGKKAAYIYNNFESIPVDKMGEGVINILGLIVDLCVAKNKLFLIEEPENDIHPKALKALLGLIAEKAKDNQFIVTTHSNIVLKTLGSVDDSAVFSINMEFEDKVPTSKVVRIGQSPSERKEILEDLGYELYDFDLWAGWLFLEESSAERIIRDYLIPWFVKPLKEKLRTFSSRSLSEVRIKFEDFNRLFVYLHDQRQL